MDTIVVLAAANMAVLCASFNPKRAFSPCIVQSCRFHGPVSTFTSSIVAVIFP